MLAGSEKTLPIINKDLNDAGISAEILTEDSEIIRVKYTCARAVCQADLIILI